jgi:D-alanyl-D-alanine carboxypeptidase
MTLSLGLFRPLTALAGLVAAGLAVTAPAAADGRYAAFVLNVDTDEVMHARNANELRHPASLTKIMTLYMLFDALDRGEVALDTEMNVSARAAGQSPTRLGLRAGQTLRVEDAILGLVTRSANDASVVIAEHLAGTEAAFAQRMTTRARELGMTSTVFTNASGLPDRRQVTTARDLAVMSEALLVNHQARYHYFSTQRMSWNGTAISNHNRLLGRIEGVDGIKTGYTRASGFNLSTSATRDGHRIVAVVMGGDTGAERDNHMIELVNAAFTELERRDQVLGRGTGGGVSPFTMAFAPASPGDLGIPGLGESTFVGMTDPNSVTVNFDAVLPRAGRASEDDEDAAENRRASNTRTPPPVPNVPIS